MFDDNARILAIAGNAALGSDLGKLLVIAVIISGISSAQTTILPGLADLALDGRGGRASRGGSPRSTPAT